VKHAYCAHRDHREGSSKGFSSDVIEFGGHSILILKIIGEDYVADDWFGCATEGREDREFDRYL